MTGRAYTCLAASLMAMGCQGDELRPSLDDLVLNHLPGFSMCPGNPDDPKGVCPPESCNCELPLSPSDPYYELPVDGSAVDAADDVPTVVSKRHILIRVKGEVSVQEAHRLAREYLKGEVTQQLPGPYWNYYVIRLLSDAPWDFIQAIARAWRHPLIVSAGTKTFYHPNPRPLRQRPHRWPPSDGM